MILSAFALGSDFFDGHTGDYLNVGLGDDVVAMFDLDREGGEVVG